MRNRKALVAVVLISMTGVALQCGSASGQQGLDTQTAKRVVGTWRLVSTTTDGKIDPNRGPNPTGLIFYDAKGHMAVQIQPDRPRPKFAGAQPTPDEAKAALAGYTAYFGTYSIDEKAGTITHHRIGDVTPGLTAQFVRRYEFAPGDRLILRPTTNMNALTWERVN